MGSSRNRFSSAPLYGMKNKWPVDGQPPEEPPRRQRSPKGAAVRVMAVVFSLVLPALFLVAVFIDQITLRWAFLALVAVALLVMWATGMFAKSARATMTLIYVALSAVVGVAIVINSSAIDATKNTPAANTSDYFTGGTAIDTSWLVSTPSDSPAGAVSAAQERLDLFMGYWSENQLSQMIDYCLPSWVAQYENYETELYSTLAGRLPLSWTFESVSGSEAESSRTVSLTATIQRNNGQAPSKYQMQVLMLRVNDVWYVDPRSLGTTPVQEYTEPTKTPAPTATPTPPPTANTLLYYNEDGGKRYHAKPDCSSVDQKYIPLTSFYYADLNTKKFKALTPCSVCSAPARPTN